MIRTVFQNSNFIVCDKPALVLSVPAREKDDLRDCLGLRLELELKTQVFPVHRLDYEVSGLILFALNARAHKVSQAWFQNRVIRKVYEAETSRQSFKHWPEKIPTDRTPIEAAAGLEFSWKTQMLRGKRRSFESAHGEWAETFARIEEAGDERVNWSLYPLTGKPHQLRLELSRRGFPITGDGLYGSETAFHEPGIALRAVELDLSMVSDRMGLPESLILPHS